MPDAIDVLTHDHREVEQLFEQYRQTRSPSVVERVCRELTVHTAVEEKVMYPVLGREVQDGAGMKQHAEEEHQEVRDAIFEIERLGHANPGVDRCMQVIMQGVADHVEEEEHEVFPAMRAQLGDERIRALGEEVDATRRRLLDAASQAGPLIDLTKDKLYELAKQRGIRGRGDMTKDQLIAALQEA
jgi:hemerythrin superfamily protein